MSHTEHLQTKGLRDVGARGHGIVIAQKMSIVLGQVVENQRSVQRTVRRDRTTSFLFVLADFFARNISIVQHGFSKAPYGSARHQRRLKWGSYDV